MSSDEGVATIQTLSLKTVAAHKRSSKERRHSTQTDTAVWTSHRPLHSQQTQGKRKISMARQTAGTADAPPLISASSSSSSLSSVSASTTTSSTGRAVSITEHHSGRPVLLSQLSLSDETTQHALETQSAPTSPTGTHKREKVRVPMEISHPLVPRRLVPIPVPIPPAVEVMTPTSVWEYFKLSPTQVVCPKCHMDIATSPFAYWPERDEIILGCGNVTIERKTTPGFRICGTLWTPSEPSPRCECGARSLTIENHYGSFYYVCSTCHVTSLETRSGQTPISPKR